MDSHLFSSCCCKSVETAIPNQKEREIQSGFFSRLGDLMSSWKGRVDPFYGTLFFFSRRSTRIYASSLLGSFHHVPLLKRKRKSFVFSSFSSTCLFGFTQKKLHDKKLENSLLAIDPASDKVCGKRRNHLLRPIGDAVFWYLYMQLYIYVYVPHNTLYKYVLLPS